ncbi:hypothetical protein BMA721280_A0922 [Burkholderia mallei 2002721280]|nr:hypothetical protein BMA721280_A0922 [Burkholderia mallei 2002721280]
MMDVANASRAVMRAVAAASTLPRSSPRRRRRPVVGHLAARLRGGCVRRAASCVWRVVRANLAA